MTVEQHAPSMTSQLYQTLSVWGVRVVWLVFVAVVLVSHFHLFGLVFHDTTTPFLTIIVTLLLFLSEVLREIRHEIVVRLDAIEENLRSERQLLTLEESVEDLLTRLKSVKRNQTVVIEHLGLDMTHAWEKFEKMIEALPNVTRIEYRLLILAAETDDVSAFDPGVRTWMANGREHEPKLADDLSKLKTRWTRARRSFNYEMRTYAPAAPFVHGLRVKEPFHVAYVALCRWGGHEYNEYRWGGDEYHRIVDISVSDAWQDLLGIFDGNFRHFWNRKSAAGLAPPSKSAPSPAKQG